MKIAFSLQQKSKIALLLFCIMACTILIRFLEDKSIKSMNNAFVSMYNDRLVPATDLFNISELLFEKMDAIEKHNLSVISETHQTTKLLVAQDFKIDSVLKKYEQTFLVTNEKNHLQLLKEKLKTHQQLEKQLISTSKGNKITIEQLNNSYKGILKNLSLLTKTQIFVGKELIKESQSLFAGSKIYSAIQFALAIVIGVLIVSIIFASNVMKIKQEKFNLN
ncbi:MCP four helix bundle domain-containing protein [Pedobacter boryungensis]|uniref:MCP four helix bundle domain-containing protein n=1 Tax=Pedobacter boryungensis TaxID=869962 RepID=A0ABX2DD86_9SPHI|nr:MCP four helix bundle domain-containing protein [Pedobacter boryungensis]NQX31494.1 MCP four helix bundle domain-containing protein [Pedobacter boryungensis]